jgi:hypothetical protein
MCVPLHENSHCFEWWRKFGSLERTRVGSTHRGSSKAKFRDSADPDSICAKFFALRRHGRLFLTLHGPGLLVYVDEMGHNFGLLHDSIGNSCLQSGFIMQAVGQSSSCSEGDFD